jgi:hypothetical protein
VVVATLPPIADATERLYTAFARYPLVDHVLGCPCCVNPKDNHDLHAAPLRHLTPAHLEHYASSALLTWGTIHDFKHFLPRLLELTTGGHSIGHTDLEVIYSKLAEAEWNTWPDPERNAVDDFLRANWLLTLSTFPPPDEDIDSLLCALGSAIDDLTPYLQIWQCGTPTAFRHLAHFLCERGPSHSNNRLRNSFWQDRRDQMHQVLTWLRSPRLSAKAEEAYFASMNEPFADELSLAVQILESLQLSAP